MSWLDERLDELVQSHPKRTDVPEPELTPEEAKVALSLVGDSDVSKTVDNRNDPDWGMLVTAIERILKRYNGTGVTHDTVALEIVKDLKCLGVKVVG